MTLEHIVIHPGFHKTGTTSLQRTLERNASLLPSEFQIADRNDVSPVFKAGAKYARSGKTSHRNLVRAQTSEFVKPWTGNRGTLIISHEGLCGPMPGRGKATNYWAAADILGEIAAGLTDIHQGCRLTFFVTTRNSAPWLESCYWQLIRTNRMKQSVDQFVDQYHSASDLQTVITKMETALAPHKIVQCALEKYADSKLGTLDALFDIVGIPLSLRAQMHPQIIRNAGPSNELRRLLFELDQSDLSDIKANEAKQHAIKSSR